MNIVLRSNRAAAPQPAQAPSRLRRWTLLLALTAAIGAVVAAASSTAVSYEQRLLDIAARQALAPDSYRASERSPLLQAVLLQVADDFELSFKMRLALTKYGAGARQVLETYGADAALHAALRRFGEPVLPVIAYFMDNDIATLRASYSLSRLGAALKAQAQSLFGSSAAAPAAAAVPEYSATARGRYAIAEINNDGHQFLAQFAIDAQGVAHWSQTDRVLKSVEDFLAGGIRNLETRYDVGAPIGAGDVALAGADLLTVFGVVKALTLLRAGRAAQWAALTDYRTLLGRRVLLGAGRVGVAALKLGAAASAVYLVLRHPGLLTSLFVETGSWLGIPPWAAAATGWWLVALLLSLMLLPLLGWITVLNPLLTHIARIARWLLGRTREQTEQLAPVQASRHRGAGSAGPLVSPPVGGRRESSASERSLGAS